MLRTIPNFPTVNCPWRESLSQWEIFAADPNTFNDRRRSIPVRPQALSPQSWSLFLSATYNMEDSKQAALQKLVVGQLIEGLQKTYYVGISATVMFIWDYGVFTNCIFDQTTNCLIVWCSIGTVTTFDQEVSPIIPGNDARYSIRHQVEYIWVRI